MQTETSVQIDRPIGEVFDYTTEHVSDWSLTCVEDEVLKEAPGGVGTTFRIVTEDRGKRMEFHGITTRHEPPRASAVHLEGQYFDIDVLYEFEDQRGGTRVTQRSAVHGKGFFKVMLGLFGWMMKRSGCKAQEAELASLKQKCEARAARSSST